MTAHCPSCTCGRRAPVQANAHERNGRVRRPVGAPGSCAGTITWEEHERAFIGYAAQYGHGQSAERLAERGGFGWWELVDFLGHEPTTWRPR